MAIVEKKWSALPVPFAIELPDRVPKERYYDPDFYRLEAELLWSRTWQMACRLEEIPRPGDFAEYEILDQSVLVVRSEDMGVRAFDNVCRHRGVRFAQGRGSKPGGFVCPFHGWCYGTDGQNTRVTQPSGVLRAQPRAGGDQPLAGALRDVGRVRLDQPRRRRAAAAGVHGALRHRPRRLEDGVAAGGVVVLGPSPRQLEARRGGLRRAVPRAPVASAAADPGPLPGTRRVRPTGVPRRRAAIPARR